MKLEYRIVSIILRYFYKKYPYLMRDLVIPEGAHLHNNPKKRKRVEVSHA